MANIEKDVGRFSFIIKTQQDKYNFLYFIDKKINKSRGLYYIQEQRVCKELLFRQGKSGSPTNILLLM